MSVDAPRSRCKRPCPPEGDGRPESEPTNPLRRLTEPALNPALKATGPTVGTRARSALPLIAQGHRTAVRIALTTLCALTLSAICGATSSRDWAAAYARLSDSIARSHPEPRGNPDQIPPYVEALHVKAPDRDEAEHLHREAAEAAAEGDDPEAREWAANFRALAELAQVSGEQTTERAMSHMKIEGAGWDNAVFNAQRLRPLFLAAQETRFAPERVRAFAHCMMRYASRDIECPEAGLGLYEGCNLPLGDWVDLTDGLSFNERCPKRKAPFEKIEPQLPCDKGLEWAEKVRAEARWWEFWPEHSQVTDAMVGYYKDVLCAFPAEQGHRWYEAEADRYSLGEALDHNQGFYATIKGKVTIEGGDEPARHVTLTITAPKDEERWETETDGDGLFEIEGVLLHKTCSPFEVETKKWCGTLQDKLDGPLEEPDPDYVHEEDFEARPALEGELEFDHRFRRKTGLIDVNIRTRGRVPFRVDFEKDPPEIEGGGSVSMSGNGTRITSISCTFRWTTSKTVTLEGTLEELPDGGGTLRFEVTDQGSGPYVVNHYCPPPWFNPAWTSQGKAAPRRKYTLDLEVVDGQALEWDNPYGSGRNRAVLHVPCTARR